ncbi:MAG: hypothetical protein M1130_04545, partial [Actinobacteria bacterium]|nr:hypothetical protein [Actinomycetota bacterium]
FHVYTPLVRILSSVLSLDNSIIRGFTLNFMVFQVSTITDSGLKYRIRYNALDEEAAIAASWQPGYGLIFLFLFI